MSKSRYKVAVKCQHCKEFFDEKGYSWYRGKTYCLKHFKDLIDGKLKVDKKKGK